MRGVKALERLYQSGMTRASVATWLGSPSQLIGLYERGQRFPSKKKFCQIVELAESRGLLLIARDFITDNTHCELGEASNG